MADEFGEAVGYAGNWVRIDKAGSVTVTDADLALVIVARHGTAPPRVQRGDVEQVREGRYRPGRGQRQGDAPEPRDQRPR